MQTEIESPTGTALAEALRNRHGTIQPGTKVEFQVENQDCWGGDLKGTLVLRDGKFFIDTVRSGRLTIGQGYDVYFHSIRPV